MVCEMCQHVVCSYYEKSNRNGSSTSYINNPNADIAALPLARSAYGHSQSYGLPPFPLPLYQVQEEHSEAQDVQYATLHRPVSFA